MWAYQGNDKQNRSSIKNWNQKNHISYLFYWSVLENR